MSETQTRLMDCPNCGAEMAPLPDEEGVRRCPECSWTWTLTDTFEVLKSALAEVASHCPTCRDRGDNELCAGCAAQLKALAVGASS